MKRIFIEKELGATPSVAEMEVVDILVINQIPKKSVKLLRANRTKGSKTADLLIDNNAYWEIKSIEKLGKYTIEHALRAGLKQAENLILDLRRLPVSLEKKAVKIIEKEYLKRKNWKGLVMIVRFDGKCLIFKK